MAELHVQRKRNTYIWLWIIIVLIILVGIYYYLHTRNSKDYPLPGKTTGYIMTPSGNELS